MRLGRWIAGLASLLLSTTALAQTTPPSSPADMGITKTTLPEVLQVLDSTRTWVPIGTVDPTLHLFTPTAGGTRQLGIVNVTDPAIGMTANTGLDNSPFVDNMNNAMGTFLGSGYSAYEAIFPGVLNGNGAGYTTNYYFSQPLHANRSAKYHCTGTNASSVILWFAPGIDGVIQDASGSFEDCKIYSLGTGTAWGNALNNIVRVTSSISGGSNNGSPAPPQQTWGIGDGFIASPAFSAYYQIDAFPAYPPGTTVTAINGGAVTGYISGRTLTTTSGNPGINSVLTGPGVAPNTFVIGGGGTSWTVSVTQTVGSVGAPVSMTASQTLTVSNPGNPFFSPNVAGYVFPQVPADTPPIPNNGQVPARSTAVFTQTGTNNFHDGDTMNVAGIIYTFAAALNSNNHKVLIGPDFYTTANNLVAAVANASGANQTYTPQLGATRDYNLPNPFVTAAYDGFSAITFTSRYGGPGQNTYSSVYTTSGAAAGSFANPTFTGADTLSSCPSPCLYASAQFSYWQLPAAQAFHITTAVGNNVIGWVQPPLPHPPLGNGDKVWTSAFPFGTTAGQIRSAAQFVETGSNNFQNGDQITVGNNTFTFRTVLTAAAGDILIGVDFPTSLANLGQGIANSPASNRGVLFNPPTNVSNVSISGSQGPTWANFYSTTFQSTTTNAFPAVYTPSGTPAGSFVTGADFSHYSAETMGQPGAGAQLATMTYPPGGEGSLWIVPTGLKKRINASSQNLTLNHWGIGESVICSNGWGFNCDLSRDENNWHQGDLVGRWAEGDNYATSSTKDEQFSDNSVADDLELGTLGESLYNPNYESTESGTSHYGILIFCGSQNSTTIYGGYIGGNNMCSNPISVIPGLAYGGPASVGLNAGSTSGWNLAAGAVSSNKPFSVLGGNDNAGTVQIGASPGLIPGILCWGVTTVDSCFGYNVGNKDWQWYQGIGAPNIAMKFVNANSSDYSAGGLYYSEFPPGIIMGGDGANAGIGGYRLFGMGNLKPAGLWHRQGDTNILTGATPGSMAGWYSAGGSSSSTSILNGTTLTVQQEIDPTPLPEVAAGGSGYGASLVGTMTGTYAGCTTQPVLNVATNSSGAISKVNSVVTRGVCPPTPVDTPWTPNAPLSAGTGADFLVAWQQAGLLGALGINQTLAGTSVIANTKIISGSGNVWTVNQSYGAPVGPETITGQGWYPFLPVSNDPANPDFTATTLRSGSASNKDIAGRVTLSGGTATYNLTGTYLTAPICLTQDATTPANANSVVETLTTLTFTGTGSDVIKYECVGRN